MLTSVSRILTAAAVTGIALSPGTASPFLAGEGPPGIKLCAQEPAQEPAKEPQ
jgi:hypothetical protein